MTIKQNGPVSRAGLSTTPDGEHTHLIVFVKNTRDVFQIFQHPPISEQALFLILSEAGNNPRDAEPLYGTAAEYQAAYEIAFEVEIAAREAQHAADLEAGKAAMTKMGLDPLSATDRAELLALLNNAEEILGA